MAFIDHTEAFKRFRVTHVRPSLARMGDSPFVGTSMMTQVEMTEDESQKPQWMKLTELIKMIVVEIHKGMDELNGLYRSSTIVRDFDSSDASSKIEVTSDRITTLFSKAQKAVMALFPKQYHQYLDNPDLPLPIGETIANLQIRKNLQMEMSTEITELSQEFRSMQRVHMQKLQGKDTSSSSSEPTSSFDEPEIVYTRGFTTEQEEAVAYARENAQERLNEIKQIARSMNELAQMFQEMHMMIVEQGTLLDRVDQNLVSARENTQEAVKELVKANEHQKASRMKLCILLLVALIVAVVICLMVFKVIPIKKKD
ncbi:Syntaxin 16A [Monocercomonoides exilis]|uniref:Syntaxin 16A n=1 Tax=Monocercomonoides exilis TaxID=2049356 RepID=UPI003559691A|nr:Syntaxin 16A [Monocercomonoides exilis]|eukprot:MONOS_11242.1-p1 / transcript=MONOS_11242.1 / gene=MONOS_11242 / organism=Monocercomonoides_exilis_PA203 / gene_product= Syntaxin 16A / transcript_product= Syntaxin 16A / location=Mono_scaffold00553:26091-27288(-) / protein_length=313 / sequence_SO=supercontig / SO=protein_coding / is_pseudo=false